MVWFKVAENDLPVDKSLCSGGTQGGGEERGFTGTKDRQPRPFKNKFPSITQKHMHMHAPAYTPLSLSSVEALHSDS